MFHDMFTRGKISCPGELSLTTIFPSKKIHNKASSQQVKFVMIRIELIFSRFKSILLGASGEGFRKQTKEGKSLFTLRGLVSCDANKTSSELPLQKMALKFRFFEKAKTSCRNLPFVLTLLSKIQKMWKIFFQIW